MAIATNISRRPGSRNYYVRMAVPRDLQVRMGTPGKPRRELRKSLNTPDAREAKRLSRPILDEWERTFAELRRPKQLTEAELQNAIWRRYLELINADERFRQELPTGDELNAIWEYLEAEFGELNITAYRIFEELRDRFESNQRERVERLAQMKVEAARGETKLIADVVEQVIEARRLGVDPGTPEYRKLAQGLQRAELEGLKRTVERDAGDFSGESKDKLVQQPTVFDPPKGEGILELYDRYAREKSGRVSADTWAQNRKVVALFDNFVGGNAHISALTRKNVREWKEKLFEWPVKAIEASEFRGLSFLDTIERNKVVGKPVIQHKTINRYLAALGGFSDWLLANDFIGEQIMQGMYLEVDRRKKTVLPYSADQMRRIFESPLFHRCGGDKLEHQKGNVEVRDWRYWIPLIAVHSGARLGEICQLMTADVRQLHDVWIFHITEEGGAGTKSTKTEGSMRVVPMHSKLIELGFLKYHARMSAMGDRLFPEIKADARGYISGKASTFFNDYFRAIGVKSDRSLNFHSFRHGFADALRRAGYYDEQFGPLLGHTKSTTTGRYGIESEMVIADRVKMVEAVIQAK
ncbi:integrase family protein [Rhodopseudomonas palustris TIE-1]|uniref:site-specific integrase n=1 Tax=Rhodopseudomonas palustris TaxID=1076 RepID=UPI000164B4A6|nr:site-specific integrase [Rhodopseudomonas palustris]ACF02493.1 integrase family protein [Rhodopseudomonas palustris TIE-1]